MKELLSFVGLLSALIGAFASENREPKLYFDAINSELCTKNGNVYGVCTSPLACLPPTGVPDFQNFCSVLNGGVCCTYRSSSCSYSTTSRYSEWQNSGYPNSENQAFGPCTYTVYPKGDVCYIRAQFEELNLPSISVDACDNNYLTIWGQKEGNGVPICGPLTGTETFVQVASSIQFGIVRLNSAVRFRLNIAIVPHKFKIRFTQILCRDITVFKAGRSLYGREGPKVSLESTKRQSILEDQKSANATTNEEVSQSIFHSFVDYLFKANEAGNITQDEFKQALKSHIPSELARIQGGGNALLATYPFMGWIRQDIPDGDYYCGAVLISSTYALTAAKCFLRRGFAASTYSSIISFNQMNQAVENTNTPIKRIIFHPMNDPKNYRYDLALVELKTAVAQTPIALPDPKSNYVGAGTIVGWGLRSAVLVTLPSATLQDLGVTIMTNDNCEPKWSTKPESVLNSGDLIKPDMVCADAAAADNGACLGDYGGPILYTEGGTNKLAGILSGSYGNCQLQVAGATRLHFDSVPDIGARITSFLDFINVGTTTMSS